MDERLSILHVQHSLQPGGMENGVVNVAAGLPRDEFEVHVCCLEQGGEFASRLPEPGNVYELGKPDRFSLATVWGLRRLIRRLRPDVVHSHNLGSLIYAALATLWGKTVPLLHGEHGQPDDGPDARRRDRQRRRLFGAAAKVHTVSHGLRQHFIEDGFPPERIVALVNGVDTDRFNPGDRAAARSELGIEADAPVALIVGRLIESKGHRVLFSAFEDLSSRFPAARLIVLGDGGADADGIKRAAEESPASGLIRMEGFQDRPELYYQAADVLVAPSTIEGLSNVVLEAMACSLPAILHDACGNREVITSGRDGVIADLSSPSGIVGELETLFTDEAKARSLGERARETVLERFSMGRMVSDYATVYRELAGRGAAT